MIADNCASAYAAYPIAVEGQPGDIYTFGGWAKATSVPGGVFRVSLEVTYTDHTTRWTGADFNKHVEEWQFSMASFDTTDPQDPTKAYAKFTFSTEYSDNANTAYFDDVFVCRDNARSYAYDKEGNLVSSEETRAFAVHFAYDGTSVAKVVIVM